jgi:thiamine biosynthesis lipoprotein
MQIIPPALSRKDYFAVKDDIRMKRIFLIVFCLVLALSQSGCETKPQYEKYSNEFLDTFDTAVIVMAYAQSDDEFDDIFGTVYDTFTELNELFDIYHDYEGINNIKTINDNAGVKPVEVDKQIIELLKLSKDWYTKTDGIVNVAMGSVLRIWHDYREAGEFDPSVAELPPIEKLKDASLHTDINQVIIDEQASTVYLSDSRMRLDVGAVAKGFATEIAADKLIDKGYESVLISAGGNVRAIGTPKDGVRSKWGVGIKDPDSPLAGSTDESNLLDVAFVTNLSVVSSGVYERFYTVDGIAYHHLIDPETLMPADYYKAVTVVLEDSAQADLLSTVLFLLSPDESLKFAENLDGVEALWVMPDNEIVLTSGMKQMLRDMGGATNSL